MRMNIETKSLCAVKKWREAIELVSRIPPAPNSGKTEAFIYLGGELLRVVPQGYDRDIFLSKVIEGLLQLGDTEHAGRFVLGLQSKIKLDKFAETIDDAVRKRQDVAGCTEGK